MDTQFGEEKARNELTNIAVGIEIQAHNPKQLDQH